MTGEFKPASTAGATRERPLAVRFRSQDEMISPVTIRIALRALGKNKMRAGLTVLGVVIGIAAVTTMVSVGQSASALVQSQFEALGTNVIIVLPEVRRRSGVMQAEVTLTARDSDAIAKECPSVLASSPIVGTTAQVIYGSSNFSPREMHGVNSDYLVVRNWPLAQRRILHRARRPRGEQGLRDRPHARRQAVSDDRPHRPERADQEHSVPRDRRARSRRGPTWSGDDQDSIILMPLTTVRKRLQGSEFDNVNAILASARSLSLMTQAQHEIDELLSERHRVRFGEKRDFTVENTTEIANTFGVVTGTLTAMLAAIAGISLVVGGVGIMNIMLVSVTERTREIGIRMAVGAKTGDILRQFLVEAVLLSCIGGVIGFALGVGASIGHRVAHQRRFERPEMDAPKSHSWRPCWRFCSRRPSACSSATTRPAAQAGWTRSRPCATNSRHRSTFARRLYVEIRDPKALPRRARFRA